MTPLITVGLCTVCVRPVYHDEVIVRFRGVLAHGKCVGVTADAVQRVVAEGRKST